MNNTNCCKVPLESVKLQQQLVLFNNIGGGGLLGLSDIQICLVANWMCHADWGRAPGRLQRGGA